MTSKKITPNEIVLNLAKSYNFDNAKFIMEYGGYNVFSPFMNNGSIPIIGEPVFIMSSKHETRIATEHETERIMNRIDD